MPYCRLFYHFVWTTKNRQPRISRELEPLLFGFIRSKTASVGGRVFAVNAYLDHVHLVAIVPPTLSVSKFIGQVKGISSVKINKSGLSSEKFIWQEEYAVFSLDVSSLPTCISYVERQKEHHSGQQKINKQWETIISPAQPGVVGSPGL
jgi:putative transposase